MISSTSPAKAMPDGGQLVIYITIGTNPQIVYADVDGDTNIIKSECEGERRIEAAC